MIYDILAMFSFAIVMGLTCGLTLFGIGMFMNWLLN
jgi:hypothetical protein